MENPGNFERLLTYGKKIHFSNANLLSTYILVVLMVFFYNSPQQKTDVQIFFWFSQFFFAERLSQQHGELEDLVTIVVDTTVCPIERPGSQYGELQRFYYSGKHHYHCVKYEVALCRKTNRVVWVSPQVRGAMHDVTVFRTMGLKDNLLPQELALADKGYVGDEKVMAPIKGRNLQQVDLIWNSIVSRNRIVIENFFSRVKWFQFTQIPWRHAIEDHELAFHTLVNILNVDLYFRPIQGPIEI